jgi:hypothetical protein
MVRIVELVRIVEIVDYDDQRTDTRKFLSSVATESNNWNRACSGSVGCGPGGLGLGCAARRSGSSCPISCATRCVAPEPRIAARCSASLSARQARTTWIHGQYAWRAATFPTPTQVTRAPCGTAKRPNSSAQPCFADSRLAGQQEQVAMTDRDVG